MSSSRWRAASTHSYRNRNCNTCDTGYSVLQAREYWKGDTGREILGNTKRYIPSNTCQAIQARRYLPGYTRKAILGNTKRYSPSYETLCWHFCLQFDLPFPPKSLRQNFSLCPSSPFFIHFSNQHTHAHNCQCLISMFQCTRLLQM